MAKFETTVSTDYKSFLNYVHEGILKGSMSSHYVDGSDFEQNGLRTAFRVYERYSALGKNRLSLSMMICEQVDRKLFVSFITSGGSQAVLFKINTIGEENFLAKVEKLLENYKG